MIRHEKLSRSAAVSALVLALIAMFLLTACPPQPSVAEIQRNPGKYAGKEIAVSGNVTETFGFMGTGAYQLDDGTGKIWVLSQGYGIPGKGAHVRVAGTLVQGASIGSRNFGMAIRQTRPSR